jgi:predicted nucleotidyltransferase
MSDTTKTPPTLDYLHAHREEIMALAGTYDITNVRIFGSVARGDAAPDSDIDFLVDFPPQLSLLDLSAFVRGLKALLDYPVQVVSAAHVRDELREYMLKDIHVL